MYISISPQMYTLSIHPSLLCAYVVHVHQIVLHHCNINLLTALSIQLNPQYIYIYISNIIYYYIYMFSFYYRSVTTFPQLLPPSVSLISSVSSPTPYQLSYISPFSKLATPHLSLRPIPPTHAAPISPTNWGFKY